MSKSHQNCCIETQKKPNETKTIDFVETKGKEKKRKKPEFNKKTEPFFVAFLTPCCW